MALTIEQKPRYKTLAAGQKVIFTVKDDVAVINETRVKFIAKVFISPTGTTFGSQLSATLKTTPNNAGVGIFDLSPILESHVSPDHLGREAVGLIVAGTKGSEYSSVEYSDTTPHPIHIIDKYAGNTNTARYFKIKFQIEFLGAGGNPNVVEIHTSNDKFSEAFLFYNGVVYEEDILYLDPVTGDFGQNLNLPDLIPNASSKKFLSDMPDTQYVRLTDYGTVAFFNALKHSNHTFYTGEASGNPEIQYIKVRMYQTGGGVLTSHEIDNTGANGGRGTGTGSVYSNDANHKIMYMGASPANLETHVPHWATHKANTIYYTLQAFDNSDDAVTQIYTFNIITDDCKGYEGIRLAWINKYGVWDYYTFTKKSIRKIDTKRTQYQQLTGTWNESKFKIHDYQGGQKNFKVSTKESITVNSDFITEDDSVWLEQLVTSPEVCIINGAQLDTGGYMRRYVEPVVVKTSSHTRKTKANDKLIQYSFEIERTKPRRTQTV